MNARSPMVCLASASPRRMELLTQIGVSYQVVAATVDETRHGDESPELYVLRLALNKARAGRAGLAATDHRLVLGADTAVVIDGEILGKPRDQEDGIAMLRRLSGNTHHVYTGVALAGGREATRLSVSAVTFRDMSLEECTRYWHTGEPADKAGAYAIQGRGAVFITRLEGSYSGVMGLPLYETAELLIEAGFEFRISGSEL
jgi:septum formation protein